MNSTTFGTSPTKRDEQEQMKRLLPGWLENMRSDLMSSQEWQNLTTVVYHSVQDRLKQNHIQFFSDLNDVEKALFIDEVERSLAHDNVYKNFQGVLSRSLDESLSNQVERELLETGSSRVNKVDMILERAAEGATRLLKRLPSEKSTMRIMLNHEFPGPLRKQAWSMFLGHPEARQKYERDVIKSRMSTISDHDADISNKCQMLIDSKFPELETHRISTLISLMKTTLSYYETLTQRDLEEVNYYLCLPLSHIYCAVNTEASAVIEAYLALMELPRPKYMSSITTFLSESLEKLDKELYEHIAQINATATTTVSGVTTETYISNLLEPHILRCFVGTVSMPVCCYIWDQALMLGSFDKMIPNFAITIMILLRDQLLSSPTTQQLERTIASHSKTITERNLQALAENSFMGDLRVKLGIKRDFAGDLYEAIDYEQNEFSQGVTGLDQSMDWESFAITSPTRAGRKTLGGPRRGQSQATNSLQQQFLQAQQTKNSYASQTYKPDDVMATKKRFDSHVNERALKRQEKELKKLKKRRKQAVEDAEEELALAEAEREAELHTTNIAKKKELLARREAFEARRREHERDLKEKEARMMKQRHDDHQEMAESEKRRLQIQSEYDQKINTREQDRVSRNEQDRLRRRGDLDEGPPYLGADDAPIMKLRLKRSDGTEHKCEIRALVDGDSQDDARVRVEYILSKEGISLDRANKVIKALLSFSKKKTQYKADWSPQRSSRSSRISTPKSSGRSTPSKGGRSADPTMKFNSNVQFYAADTGLTFDLEKDSDGKSVFTVQHVAHSSEAAAKIWKGDKLLKLGANDIEPDATLGDIRKILDESKRPVTLFFQKSPPYLGSTKAAIFSTLIKDSKRQKVKLNIRSLVDPDNELHAEQRAAWFCMINDVLEVDKIKRALIDFSKKNGYTPPPAPRVKTPPKVKIDRKKEPGEFDLYFQDGPLGMSIDHHDGSEDVHVIAMSKDGQAAGFKKIRIDDIIVMIADTVVLGQTTNEVKKVIVAHERPLRIRFRHENGLDDEEDAQLKNDQANAKKDSDAKKEADAQAAKIAAYNNTKYEVETDKDGKVLFNGAPPLVAAIHSVMKGLQLIAFGDELEQETIHGQIEQEDKYIFEDFDNARTKLWGSKLNDDMINAFSSAQKTKYDKLLVKKIQPAAYKNYTKRMDALAKEARKKK